MPLLAGTESYSPLEGCSETWLLMLRGFRGLGTGGRLCFGRSGATTFSLGGRGMACAEVEGGVPYLSECDEVMFSGFRGLGTGERLGIGRLGSGAELDFGSADLSSPCCS